MISTCHDCRTPIDWSRPMVIRVFVADRHGKEWPLCIDCWSKDSKPKAVRK